MPGIRKTDILAMEQLLLLLKRINKLPDMLEVRQKEREIRKKKMKENKERKRMPTKTDNQSPKGKMWSAVPLFCFDSSMSQPLK